MLNILGEYSSSKKLLDSNLEWSTRVTRHSTSKYRPPVIIFRWY